VPGELLTVLAQDTGFEPYVQYGDASRWTTGPR
jgi:hypothetical protein